MKHKLEQELRGLIKSLFPKLDLDQKVLLQVDNLNVYGNYSSNIAFIIAARLSGHPEKYAKKILKAWTYNLNFIYLSISSLGYINFTFTPLYKMQLLHKLVCLDVCDSKNLKCFKKKLISGLEFRNVQAFNPDPASLASILYAKERTYFILEYLGFGVTANITEALFICFNPDELLLLNLILKVDDELDFAISLDSPENFFRYLKNVAKTIHYLYNKIILVSGDAQKDFVLRCLLQAAYNVLNLSLQGLGVGKP